MTLSPLPPTSDFITTGETKGTFKGALSGLRAFLNSLLGSTGAQSDALTGLGALMNGTLSKSATYMVAETDRGKLIDCTGTFDLTIDAIATLAPGGAGFAFAAANSGTGSITINPNLSEPINGAATFVLGPNESCIVTTDATAAGWRAILVGSSGVTGQVAYYPTTTAPTGWIKMNGSLLSRTSYAALWAYAQASGNLAASDGVWQAGQFSPGDGSTTFRIPDGRSEFIRGWDDSRGVDSGRAIGSWQASQMQSHTHSLADGLNSGGASGVNAAPGSGPGSTGAAGGTSNGSENRPRSIALLACIKY